LIVFSKNKSFWQELQRPKISRNFWIEKLQKLKIKTRKIKNNILFKDKSVEEEDNYFI